MVAANDIEQRLDRIERLLTKSERRERKQSRRLGFLITKTQIESLGIDAILCGVCLGAVGLFWLHNYVKEAIVENAPAWVVNILFPHMVDGVVAGGADGVAFEPLEIATPFFIDESPPGSYDFTLLRGGSVHVDVPSPCNGSITDAGMMGGYGNAIEVTCSDSTILFMAHFASLYLGKGDNVTRGQSLGKQGSTGNSTGEHIHLEVTLPGKAMTDRSVTRPYVEDVLFPFWKAGISKTAASGGNFNGFPIDAYKQAIAAKESGNNYGSVNSDSGALGKYQFMPATMRSNALRCDGVGYQPTESEFLNTPDLQEKVMSCYLMTGLKTIQQKTGDIHTQCRMLASYHYSGDPDLWNNGSPQTYGGNSYPSIASYTADICKGIK